MEPQIYGISETKDVLKFAFKLGGALKESFKDGKFQANDVGNLLPVFPTIGPAFENISLIPKEISDIDAAEFEELKKEILSEGGELMDNEKLLVQINAGLEFVHSGYKLYIAFKD